MPGFAPGFPENANTLPVNTNPLTDRQTRDALIATTVGAATPVSTVATRGRVKHNSSQIGDNGGKMVIETINPINRNNAAADVTALKAKTTLKNPSFSFPRDLSGNGGPAFTRS